MRDSAIGAYGATTLFLVLTARTNALTTLERRAAIPFLLLAPTLSRWSMVGTGPCAALRTVRRRIGSRHRRRHSPAAGRRDRDRGGGDVVHQRAVARDVLEATVLTAVDHAIEAARNRDVIAVSNDVGSGIVPDDPVGRQFRDLRGLANQRLGQAADCVVWLVAGLPIMLKGGP
jgi:hypothetical protein